MTLTPTPVKHEFYASCDGCRRVDLVSDDAPTPMGWIPVYLDGYVGSFQACSEECASKILRKKRALPER